MRFAQTTFTIKTKISEKSPVVHTTTVTLTESDVPEQTVADSATSGQSPRVRWQGNWRRSVDGTIPTTVTMSWADWFGSPPRVASVARDMTPAEAAAKAANNSAFLDELIAELQKRDLINEPSDAQ